MADALFYFERATGDEPEEAVPLLSSIALRAKLARIGVWHFTRKAPVVQRIRIRGTPINLSFPKGEKEQLGHEFWLIYMQDCYGLKTLQAKPKQIVDVGANVGLFSLVARQRFPSATIHAYEPNAALETHLSANLKDLKVKVYLEAVSRQEGSASLVAGDGSMFSTTRPGGPIPSVSLETVVERCGGRIDLLKLDCEGAEWELFESPALDGVSAITMEFHLWARRGSTIADIEKLLRKRGFRTTKPSSLPGAGYGLIRAYRQ